MSYDPSIVRHILRELYVEVPGHPHVVTETFMLAPLGIPSDPANVELHRHLDRLEELGWIQISRDVHMRPPPDPLTYRPTREAGNWARFAFDDRLWEEHQEEVRAALERDERAHS